MSDSTVTSAADIHAIVLNEKESLIRLRICKVYFSFDIIPDLGFVLQIADELVVFAHAWNSNQPPKNKPTNNNLWKSKSTTKPTARANDEIRARRRIWNRKKKETKKKKKKKKKKLPDEMAATKALF